MVETLRSPLALTGKGISRFSQSLKEYEEEKDHQAASAKKGQGKDKNRKTTALQTLGRRPNENNMMETMDRKKFPREFDGFTNERKGSKRGSGRKAAAEIEEDEEEDDDDVDMKNLMRSNSYTNNRDSASRRTVPSLLRKRGGRGAESEDSMMSDSLSSIDSRGSRGGRARSSISISRSVRDSSEKSSVVDVVNEDENAEPSVGRGRKGRLPRPSRPAPRARKPQDEDDDE